MNSFLILNIERLLLFLPGFILTVLFFLGLPQPVDAVGPDKSIGMTSGSGPSASNLHRDRDPRLTPLQGRQQQNLATTGIQLRQQLRTEEHSLCLQAIGHSGQTSSREVTPPLKVCDIGLISTGHIADKSELILSNSQIVQGIKDLVNQDQSVHFVVVDDNRKWSELRQDLDVPGVYVWFFPHAYGTGRHGLYIGEGEHIIDRVQEECRQLNTGLFTQNPWLQATFDRATRSNPDTPDVPPTGFFVYAVRDDKSLQDQVLREQLVETVYINAANRYLVGLSPQQIIDMLPIDKSVNPNVGMARSIVLNLQKNYSRVLHPDSPKELGWDGFDWDRYFEHRGERTRSIKGILYLKSARSNQLLFNLEDDGTFPRNPRSPQDYEKFD